MLKQKCPFEEETFNITIKPKAMSSMQTRRPGMLMQSCKHIFILHKTIKQIHSKNETNSLTLSSIPNLIEDIRRYLQKLFTLSIVFVLRWSLFNRFNDIFEWWHKPFIYYICLGFHRGQSPIKPIPPACCVLYLCLRSSKAVIKHVWPSRWLLCGWTFQKTHCSKLLRTTKE